MMTDDAHLKPSQRWSRRAAVYHIYPRSFQDSNGDGIGDLQGIIDRLDYLNDGTEDSLGIGAIWLGPVYRSPMRDFGYDVADFTDIDPIFGNLATFDELVAQCHRRGIKVIMDFVANHTSDQHPWFLESKSSRTSPKREWYIWHDPGPDGSVPNNWLSVFGGSGWTLHEPTGQSYFHSFLPEQPDLNWHNPAVREAMLDVLKFWVGRGVDGFRTDAAYHLIKDSQFRDDPPNPNYNPVFDKPYRRYLHTYSQQQPEALDQTHQFCAAIGDKDSYLISEAYLSLDDMTQFYRACDHGEHAPFNFSLLWLEWSADAYRQFVDKFEESLEPHDWPNYVLSNHDKTRVASRLGPARARAAAMILFTLRGMPFLYYGDELGIEDVSVPPDRRQDPVDPIHTVPGGRDKVRTPMQWSDDRSAGFSTTEPWLPVETEYQERNVAAETKDPTSMLALHKRLIWLRAQSPALLTGRYQAVHFNNPAVFAYRRVAKEQQLEIFINFTDHPQTVQLDHPIQSILCSTAMDHQSLDLASQRNLQLRPNEGVILDISGIGEAV